MNTLSKITMVSMIAALSLGAASPAAIAGPDNSQRLFIQQVIARLQAKQQSVETNKLADCKQHMEHTQIQPKS